MISFCCSFNMPAARAMISISTATAAATGFFQPSPGFLSSSSLSSAVLKHTKNVYIKNNSTIFHNLLLLSKTQLYSLRLVYYNDIFTTTNNVFLLCSSSAIRQFCTSTTSADDDGLLEQFTCPKEALKWARKNLVDDCPAHASWEAYLAAEASLKKLARAMGMDAELLGSEHSSDSDHLTEPEQMRAFTSYLAKKFNNEKILLNFIIVTALYHNWYTDQYDAECVEMDLDYVVEFCETIEQLETTGKCKPSDVREFFDKLQAQKAKKEEAKAAMEAKEEATINNKEKNKKKKAKKDVSVVVPSSACPAATAQEAMERARERLREALDVEPQYRRYTEIYKGHLQQASYEGWLATDIALKKLAKAKNFPEECLNGDERKCSFARFLNKFDNNNNNDTMKKHTIGSRFVGAELRHHCCHAMDVSGVERLFEEIDELCQDFAKLEATCTEEELKPWFDQNPPTISDDDYDE